METATAAPDPDDGRDSRNSDVDESYSEFCFSGLSPETNGGSGGDGDLESSFYQALAKALGGDKLDTEDAFPGDDIKITSIEEMEALNHKLVNDELTVDGAKLVDHLTWYVNYVMTEFPQALAREVIGREAHNTAVLIVADLIIRLYAAHGYDVAEAVFAGLNIKKGGDQ